MQLATSYVGYTDFDIIDINYEIAKLFIGYCKLIIEP